MATKINPYCLVLSGGGAKGIYHIGVWRALREIGIPVTAFVGNSIGAIVAGFLAQGKGDALEKIGNKIGLDFILNVPDELMDGGEFKLSVTKLSTFKSFYKSIVSRKGLDTSPLRKMLVDNLDEGKIRNSGNDLGVVAFNVSDMTPREIFIEDMEEGSLLDYLMASSAFPGFERPEIAGKKYVDGGVYSNIPYTMAKQRGYKRIIVVDISGVGVTRKMDFKGVDTIYIKNSIDFGGVLDFDREFLDRYLFLGYLDTLRVFGLRRGYNYTIKIDEKREEAFRERLLQTDETRYLTEYTEEWTGKTVSGVHQATRLLFPKPARFSRSWFTVFVDSAAILLSIERIQDWSYPELLDEISERLEALRMEVDALGSKSGEDHEGMLQAIFNKETFTREPYYYYLMLRRFIPRMAQKLLLKVLSDRHPELPAGNYFLTRFDELAGK